MKKIRLKYLVKSVSSGGTPASDNSLNYTEENGINWVAIGDMSNNPYVFKTQKQITKLGQKEKRLKIYPIDTILYSIYATVGKVSVLKVPATINQAILAIEPDETKITRDFLKYSLMSLEDNVLEDVSTNTQSNLNAEKVKNFRLTVWSLDEQREITKFLDEKIHNIDSLIDAVKLEIEELIKYRNTKIREFMLSNIQGENLRLQDVCIMKKGPFGSSLKKEMFVPKKENTYKVYEQQHAIEKDFDLGEYYITKSKYAELYGFRVKPGDIIISCAGTIGEIFILPENIEDGIINQALMRVRTKKGIMKEYFCFVWRYLILEDILISSNGSAIKNIPPFSYLKKIKLVLPSLTVQESMCEKINKIYEEVENLINFKISKIQEINLYKKSLIYEMVNNKEVI